MRITRLRLSGFKSFVDPTEMAIDEGLTGVVGPNGCGKSNLLEALRWVMGETRPKAMRGAGMEDVIFAGTESRPARHAAEVALRVEAPPGSLLPPALGAEEAIEVSRRISRDGGSTYRAGGREKRARDVQLLFADAATGAQSPALVRQGQIGELISAKPKSRRRVLEDAAGISGLYQRRHEASLKLDQAEANLARLDDVIGRLAEERARLDKQARQAARYRTIAEALRRAEALQLLLAWQEAAEASRQAEEARGQAITAAAGAEARASQAARAREQAEAALTPCREEETVAAAIRARLERAREALESRAAEAEARRKRAEEQIAEITRDIAREEALDHDAGASIAALEAEAGEIAAASDGHEAALDEARASERQAEAARAEAEEAVTAAETALARLLAHHDSVSRALTEAETRHQRHARQAADAARAAEAAEAEHADAASAEATAQAEEAAAGEAATATAEALVEAERARRDAAAAEGEARTAHAQAKSTAATLAAEVQSLERLIERETGGEGALLEQITVAPGYEAALGAAMGEDLALPPAGDDASGWAELAPLDAPPPLPEGAEPLGPHVGAPPLLARRLALIGVVEAGDGARLQHGLAPGQRLVSRAGDLWRWDGLRLAAGAARSSAELRLERINRLRTLTVELTDAEQRAAQAGEAHARLVEALDARAGELERARRARDEADRRLAEAGRARTRAEAGRIRAESRRDSAREGGAHHRDETEAAAADAARAREDAAGLEDPDAARAGRDELKARLDAARETADAARSRREALERAGKARARRREEITRALAGWRKRRESAGGRVGELTARLEAATAERDRAAAEPGEIATERARLEAQIAEAEARHKRAADALAAAEGTLSEARKAERESERAASEAREARARADTKAQAADEARDSAAARITAELEEAPEALARRLEPAEDEAHPSAEALAAEITRLTRQRDALGAVNLRAEQDAAEVAGEHDRLTGEKAEVEEAIARLRRAIGELNREGRGRLLAAFEKVNANFGALFQHLFAGGTARLVLVDSDDPLEAGLEIMAQPPGKKLATLSLLSGGEQTLTALALIFAVFLTNPSPICVLDEVDAPLDDANVARFCDLLDEMIRRTDTRFLVITHNAITMSRMERLFGVTMAERGVSQLVSVDLKRAEAMVA